jgi:hypothetical protein
VQGLGEGLVIRKDVELPAVKHIPEMPEAEIGGEQLAIKGRVFQLRGIQLLAEEGEGPPAAAAAAAAGLPLLQDSSNVGVARIYSQAEVRRRVWMGEGGHLGQSVLDQLEAVLHGGRPYPALQSARNASVRGRRMLAAAGMNCLQKFTMPKTVCNCFLSRGAGNS